VTDALTLGELATTVALLAALGLVAGRFGLSAIPAYLVAGILLGPHEPTVFTLVEPSEVTEFVAEIGLVFLLFFLGLEFTLERVLRSGRHFGTGGSIDLLVNGALGLVVGLAAFGPTFEAIVLGAAVYVSSSAVAIKGLIDFRRLADDETDLVLAILVFEDLAIALVLGVTAGGGGAFAATLELVAKAIAFIALSLAASRWLAGPIDRALDRLPRESFLLFTFALVTGMAGLARALDLSEAIGALMAGVVLAGTSVRADVEDRFFSVRDLFGALFFFVFGLSIDIGALDDVAWLLTLAVVVSVAGKFASSFAAGRVGGFTARQSMNAAAALVPRGEFTIILAQLVAANPGLDPGVQEEFRAFAGLYVLVMAVLGVLLMKESKRLGRALFPRRPRLAETS
jgi:CPA2 family monovalent cation:H+ antiporter-2